MDSNSEPSSSLSNGSICDNLSISSSTERTQTTDHSNLIKLSSCLELLLENSRFTYSDATIIVENIKIGVHRSILAVRSPFFHNLFERENLPEYDLQKELLVGHVGYEAFHIILTYLYTGKLKPSPNEVATCMDDACDHRACRPAINFNVEMLYAAHNFNLSELVSSFQTNIMKDLQKTMVEDVFPVLMVAHNCGFKLLLSRCIEQITRSDIDNTSMAKEFPEEIFKQIKERRKRPLQEDEHNVVRQKRIKSIHKALDADDVELVDLLLKESGITLDDAYALHYAVAYCDSKVVKQVLARDQADANLENSRGYTVLHIAAFRRDPQIILGLLEKGASPIKLTSDGRSAVDICSRSTRPKDYFIAETGDNEAHRYKHSLDFLKIHMEKKQHPEIPPLHSDSLFDQDWYQRLLYLEIRVAFARVIFPSAADIAMKFANADKTSEFFGFSVFRGYDPGVDPNNALLMLDENNRERIIALTKTVETARTYFPNCFKAIDVFMEDDVPDLIYLTKGTPEEQSIKTRRFKKIKREVKQAFMEDQKLRNSLSDLFSSASSSSVEAPCHYKLHKSIGLPPGASLLR